MATKIISFSDNPAQIDELNSEKFHNGLAELIRVAKRPFVLAVVGLWGSGKTTLVNHALGKLNSEYQIIRFNAWSHSKSMPLLKALLVHMNNEKDENWKTVKEELKSLAKSPIAAATVRGIGSLAGPVGMILAEIGAKGIEGLASQPDKEDQNDAVEEFTSKFWVIAQKFDEDGKPLVFFIDDLDRCTPKESLDFIDDIKVYLTIDAPVVFVVALDRRTLDMGIKAKYGMGVQLTIDDYLQKIFSYTIDMPFFPDVGGLVKSIVADFGKREPYIDLEETAKSFIDKYSLTNLRTVKRILRKWLLLMPTNINKFLTEAKVPHQGVTSETKALAEFLFILCILFELYQHIFKMITLSRGIEALSDTLSKKETPLSVPRTLIELYLRENGTRQADIAQEVETIINNDLILVNLLSNLSSSMFLAHSDIRFLKDIYILSIPTLVDSVAVGLPLIK